MDKNFWKAAGTRAVRTFCQTALALLGTAAVSDSINWLSVLSSAFLAAILSLLTSITTGLPEAPSDEN